MISVGFSTSQLTNKAFPAVQFGNAAKAVGVTPQQFEAVSAKIGNIVETSDDTVIAEHNDNEYLMWLEEGHIEITAQLSSNPTEFWFQVQPDGTIVDENNSGQAHRIKVLFEAISQDSVDLVLVPDSDEEDYEGSGISTLPQPYATGL